MIKRIKFIHVLTIIAILIATVIMLTVMFSDDYDDSELRTQVVTAAIGLLLSSSGYWIQSSNESNRKTDLLAQSQPVESK